MKGQQLLYAIAGAAALIAARGANADACTLHGNVSVVTYWDGSSSYNPVVTNDNRCDPKSGGGQTCRLQGYYITPSPTPSGALPTIVFIHGSGGTMPGSYCETLNAFVDRGYVVFAPVMRGVSGSVNLPNGSGGSTALTFAPNTTNTGIYIETWAANNVTSSCGVSCETLIYMDKESRDIDSAFHWLVQAHPTRTDLSRIALIGHSYGGATVSVAQAAGSNLTFVPTVTVSLSGAGMSWAPSSAWETTLAQDADNWRAPMYFQRVINESPLGTVDSAIDQYTHVIDAGGAARVAAYSSYTITSAESGCADFDWHKVHCGFVFEAAGVATWIDGVKAFLDDYGVK